MDSLVNSCIMKKFMIFAAFVLILVLLDSQVNWLALTTRTGILVLILVLLDSQVNMKKLIYLCAICVS